MATLGELSVEQVFMVEEARKATRLEASPKSAQAITGHKTRLELKAMDQFGGRMSLKGVKIDIDGPAGGRFGKGGFVASKPGDYKVTFTLGELSATVEVAVRELKDINLACLAKVTASDEENAGMTGAYAADGDPKTRWGSAHHDGAWICFDLGQPYTVSRADITWENARADHYRIEVSADGVQWRKVLDVPHAKGGRESVAWKPTAARYVRLLRRVAP